MCKYGYYICEFIKLRRYFSINTTDSDVVMSCSLGYIQCNDTSCISEIYKCDGISNCPSAEDEQECSCSQSGKLINNSLFCANKCYPDDCACPALYTQRTHGGCVPLYVTPSIKQLDEWFSSHQGDKILMLYVNDTIPDCPGGDDEEELQKLLVIQNQPSLITYIADDLCTHYELPCHKGHSKCFNVIHIYLYDLDRYNNIMYCRNGGHLQNCDDTRCSNAYKCYKSYYIPHRRVCDGVTDCPAKDDEYNCEDCTCINMLRC